jgi:hypothetical protein
MTVVFSLYSLTAGKNTWVLRCRHCRVETPKGRKRDLFFVVTYTFFYPELLRLAMLPVGGRRETRREVGHAKRKLERRF